MCQKKKYGSGILIFLLLYLGSAINLKAQYSLVFYNVENLFDCVDDPHTDDDAFTPEGDMQWTQKRYKQKLGKLFKVFAGIGENEAPALIGLAEVENRTVLKDLCEKTPLARVGYEIIHRDSPDPRGIDVALLYRKDLFTCVKQRFISVEYQGRELESREVLLARLVHKTDSVNVMVTHWPSRYGGAYETTPLRKAAAESIHKVLQEEGGDLPLVLMGDFNCSSRDEEMQYFIDLLKTGTEPSLVPLEVTFPVSVGGTYKYQGNWQSLDHLFANQRFLQQFCGEEDTQVNVYAPASLLGEDSYAGYKPFRTYLGPWYQGGTSDHLPLSLSIRLF